MAIEIVRDGGQVIGTIGFQNLIEPQKMYGLVITFYETKQSVYLKLSEKEVVALFREFNSIRI